MKTDVNELISVANSKHAAVIFLTTPNNPSGNVTSVSDVEKLCQRTHNCFVVVDEAYIQFGGTTAVPLVGKYPSLVILHTFSKWAALAGLRVGYSISHPVVARCIDAVKQPYNVNSAADIAARVALANKPRILKEQIQPIM